VPRKRVEAKQEYTNSKIEIREEKSPVHDQLDYSESFNSHKDCHPPDAC
jgi:hypothetical protein